MTALRDGMPRAYIRVDPNIDQHPDCEGMIRLLCAGARQPERGRFKDLVVVRRALGVARTKRLVDRGDIIQLPDGRWYADGWDEWQEGDHTVAERMRRMRARRAAKRHRTVSPVTEEPSPDRNDVTTDAVRRDSLVSTSGDDDRGDTPPPAKLGRRKNGTNARATGTNPRANGTSPRQIREDQKRGSTGKAGEILAAIAAGRKPG